ISQLVHIALDAKATVDAAVSPIAPRPLSAPEAELSPELQENVADLILLVDTFQAEVNNPTLVTDVNSLLNAAEFPIEEIMLFPFEIEGFAERYPELAEAEGLDTVPPAPKAPEGPQNPEGGDPEAGTPASGEGGTTGQNQ
ncbi:MAG: hypothetical protein KDB22_17530, partial [Planctomycetales bacterium]|nr:hypothetical protein [Planctomycetales bacterium]